MISWKKIVYFAAEEAYNNEVIDTEMKDMIIGEGLYFASKEDWIEARIQEWKDEFVEVKDK